MADVDGWVGEAGAREETVIGDELAEAQQALAAALTEAGLERLGRLVAVGPDPAGARENVIHMVPMRPDEAVELAELVGRTGQVFPGGPMGPERP
jgi:hypothetical protein